MSDGNIFRLLEFLFDFNIFKCLHTGIIVIVCCSHCRPLGLYEESINTQVGFVSLRCDSFQDYESGLCDGNEKELMGDPTPSRLALIHVTY